jgi:C-22 sterol desaturase
MAADISNSSILQFESRTLLLKSSQRVESWLGSLAGWSTWQYVLTFLLAVVVYDQGK